MAHTSTTAIPGTPADDDVQPGSDPNEAIPVLLDRHGGQLYRLGLRLCGNHADAQDLLQETFLQAFRKWNQFEGRSRPSTWLYTIAARACRRMHRLRAGQPENMESLQALLPFGEPLMAMVPDITFDPAREAGRNELRERVEQAIGELPVSFRMPLILKDIVELSVEETASVLGLKPETVKTRVHRARLRLRSALVRALPRKPGPPAAYSKGICLDLLKAKQDAMDRGVPFPVQREVLCDRCLSVFSTLDLGAAVCRAIGQGELPPDVRRQVERLLKERKTA